MAKIELKHINKTLQSSGFAFEKSISRTFMTIFGNGVTGKTAAPQIGSFSLEDINLTIPDGKSMVILGPSGCGKTTLLRLIAGLISPDSGEVYYDDVNFTDLPPRERRIGMVFQSYALYPQYSSKENILSYFLFRKKTPELEQEAQEKFQRTSELMGVDINHLLGRMPNNLSGGERQRVALARCITRDPALFLLDEPFSNLDQKLREKYRINLKRLLQHFRITTVYVTHDQHEAVILADEISIMDKGRIVQTGTYRQLYEQPVNLFVAEFLNLDYETRAINVVDGGKIGLAYAGKSVGFRPENAEIVPKGMGALEGEVIDATELPLKKKAVVTVRRAEDDIQLYMETAFPVGERVGIKINRFHVFDPASGERIDA